MPSAMICSLCGKHIAPDEKFVQCRDNSNVYCSRRCYYYDFVQNEKKIDPIYAHIDDILNQHGSNMEQKMNLLEAINEISSAVLSVYGIYWFFPDVYESTKWDIYQMFKMFNATPVNLDQLASDLYQMRDIGVCG